jgi:hypothetical protein
MLHCFQTLLVYFISLKLSEVQMALNDTNPPDVSDEHHKFQLRTGAARMLSFVDLPIGNIASDCNHQVCFSNILSVALPKNLVN